ncbi:MAG: Fic family protein [Propionivibrio sp.]|uniref:Fic family protein n=1 Tax=Propionivibrio sp. TaxID=2212460 RepID=UPI001A60AF53|nr:Fic family protein [Propionivibrio sp.]MBL8414906.1 Fic family protein [Propionivibrio sp.]
MTRLYLGYEILIRKYQLRVPPLRCVYAAAERAIESRTFNADGEERIELPLQRITDTETLVGQLTFAFKREQLNLTVLGALFEVPEVIEAIQVWLLDKPSSKYSRMAGHLAAWLTGHEFEYSLPAGCPRVPLLDPTDYIVGPAVPDPKFGIVSNLLGDKWFSPLIRRTEKLKVWLAAGLAGKVGEAFRAIEPEMLARAVDYLYLSETRSTYSIEDEIPDNSRAAKFRHLLEQAGEPGLLTEYQLGEWQSQIMSARAAEYQYRHGQNWLSRAGRLRNIADFIPAPPDLVRPMMESVARVALAATTGALDPVLASACAAFGFVFVHPFWDGNGRLHRFLLHHILRQAGFTPAGVVLPMSARMLKQLDRYSALLKRYSRPRTELLDYALDGDSATIHMRSPQPRWLYAYHDFTDICEFIYECCQACVEEDLQTEIVYLRAHDATVRDLEAWLDMRQAALNTLIDVIVQGHGVLSKRKHKLAEGLSDEDVARIEATVAAHFSAYIDHRAHPGV